MNFGRGEKPFYAGIYPLDLGGYRDRDGASV